MITFQPGCMVHQYEDDLRAEVGNARVEKRNTEVSNDSALTKAQGSKEGRGFYKCVRKEQGTIPSNLHQLLG
jgi:hypothetical protein